MKLPQFMSTQGFTRAQIRTDFMAALVVTAIAIPESLGFAAIVGLPLQTGLYCALLAPIIFAIFTSSRHLIVGADSATAALVASGASAVAVVGSHAYPNAVATLTLLTGIVLLLMSALRVGFLADLISKPVFIGFLAGIGVQLMIGKLPDMLGLDIHGNTVQKAVGMVQNFGHIDPITVFFAGFSLALIILTNKRKLPGSLIALAAGILTTYALSLQEKGLAVVENVPGGLPLPTMPHIDIASISALLPAALSIAVVILVQSSAVIRNTAARFDEPVDDNRDLAALGMANLASSLTHGFAINGSPPRSTAAEMSGGRTQMVNVYMGICVAVLLLFFTKFFAYIPLASLGAVVFTIGMHLFDVPKLRHIWRSRRTEGLVALVALGGVALFGVQYGVAIAVITSVLDRMRRQYRPTDDILLRDQKLAGWAEDRIDSHHKHRSSPPGVLVYRFSGSIFFENANYFAQRLTRAIHDAKKPVHYLILDAGAINDLDYTAAEVLKHLCMKCSADDIKLVLAHVPPELERLLDKFNLTDIIGRQNIYPSLEAAVFNAPSARRNSLDMVARLSPPPKEFIVIGGGVLEALSLRKTNDLDLVVSSKLYRHYQDKKWKEYVQDDGKKILSHNGYQIMTTYVGKSLRDLLPHAQYIADVPFMSAEDLIACKKKMGRRKDLEDIKLLEHYLRSQHQP